MPPSLPIRRLWRNVTAWRVALSWWLAELPSDVELLPNPAEVEAVHWLTADEIRAHPDLLQGNISFLQALRDGTIRLDG